MGNNDGATHNTCYVNLQDIFMLGNTIKKSTLLNISVIKIYVQFSNRLYYITWFGAVYD